jgi:hypothetical protein
VNLLQNKIGIEQAKVLASILKKHPALKSLCGNKGDETKLDLSGKQMDAGDVIMLVAEIVGNGAMTSLNISNNLLVQIIGWRHGRSQVWKYYHSDGRKQDEKPEEGMGKPDLSGAIILADAIPDMGALFSVDVGNNDIPADKLQEIDQAIRSNRLRLIREDNNKSLSEIDLSSRYLDATDVTVVAEYIKDNEALSSLDLSKNGLNAKAHSYIADMLRVNTTLKILNYSGNDMSVASGAQAFAKG